MDTKELKALSARLEGAPEALREAKRTAFETAAPRMKAALDARIGGAGKVQSWQAPFVGTRGGYAAVRPRGKTYAEDSRGRRTKYAVGHVTQAIESGHSFPRTGKTKSSGMVFGRYFYRSARLDAEKIAEEAVRQAAETVTRYLEG